MSASKAPHNVSLLRLFKYFGVLVNTYKDTDINSIVYAARLYLNWPMFWSILNNNYQVPKKWSIKQYFVLATEYNTGLFENYRHGGVLIHHTVSYGWRKGGNVIISVFESNPRITFERFCSSNANHRGMDVQVTVQAWEQLEIFHSFIHSILITYSLSFDRYCQSVCIPWAALLSSIGYVTTVNNNILCVRIKNSSVQCSWDNYFDHNSIIALVGARNDSKVHRLKCAI